MRKDLNIFIDPATKEPLKLKVFKEDEYGVMSGELLGASKKYPVINGIPRFVPKKLYSGCIKGSAEDQTAKSFGNKWREKRNRNLGYCLSDVKILEEQFLAMLGCNSVSQLKKIFKSAGKTLNAGCGVAWSEYLFNLNLETQRHCIDFSLSVKTAFDKTKHWKNVIVSQASIFELPYPDNTFDIVSFPHPLKFPISGRALRRSALCIVLLGFLVFSLLAARKPFLPLSNHAPLH